MPRYFVTLIVAVALFMETMDSTVIATSLPAIANDLGEDPIALKLALTSYLLSLAVFIPLSGWAADRYGARTVFRAAIVVFTFGSATCGFALVPARLRRLTHRARHRRRHDGAGGPARHFAHGAQVRADLGPRLAHHSGADGAGDRAAARRLHHHLRLLAVDLLDQHSHRRPRRHPCHVLHPEFPRGGAAAARREGLHPVRHRALRSRLRLHHHRPGTLSPGGGCGAAHCRLRRVLSLCPSRPHRDRAAPRSQPAQDRYVLCQRRGRLHLSRRHRRHALSAAAPAPARLRPHALSIRHAHVLDRGRRHRHESHGGADPAPLRVQTGAGDQRRW